jgi:DNA-binding PadR family transcriptional regulator
VKDVQALSQGQVVLSTGTLYGALSRLLDQSLIERVEEEDPAQVARPRKFYTLTRLGRRVLEVEMERPRALPGLWLLAYPQPPSFRAQRNAVERSREISRPHVQQTLRIRCSRGRPMASTALHGTSLETAICRTSW